MMERNQIYRCTICGNIVEVVNAAKGTLSCCGQPMKLMKENTTDGAREKHVPVVERIDGGYKVMIGSVEHPMADNHYIQWIELSADNMLFRKFLTPGEKPEAIFKVDVEEVTAREYCNLHGLWEG